MSPATMNNDKIEILSLSESLSPQAY